MLSQHRGQYLGFTGESGHAFSICGEDFGQALQGHISVELRIGGTVHLTDTAFAELRRDLVMIDALPYQHGSPDYRENLSSEY